MKVLIIFFSFIFFNSISYSHEIDENKIKEIIKNFILENPSLIKNSLIDLNQKQKKNRIKNILLSLDSIPNPTLTKESKKINVYEFFDYNCGYCKSVLNNVLNAFKKENDVSITFVEFPILSKTSMEASLAALSAHKQNKYLQYHTKLMNHKGKISKKLLLDIAKDVKLDIEKFKKEISNPKLLEIIEDNRMIANELKLQGTPAFIIGNKIYPGAMSEQDLKRAIRIAREMK